MVAKSIGSNSIYIRGGLKLLHNPKVGELVLAKYKSGVYIGELFELGSPRAVVKVLAVAQHPEQGDLHHPMDGNVSFFHQRRALAFQEKTLVPLVDLSKFEGTVPDYNQSLNYALQMEQKRLLSIAIWAEKGLEQLNQLKNEY